MIAHSIPRGGYFGRVTDPVREQGLEVQRAPQRSEVFDALFLAISGAAHRERGKPRGQVRAQARADISIPGGADPLPGRDAGGWISSPSRQPLIRRMRHCPRRDLRVIRFPDPRPTAPGPCFGVCGRGVFGGVHHG